MLNRAARVTVQLTDPLTHDTKAASTAAAELVLGLLQQLQGDSPPPTSPSPPAPLSVAALPAAGEPSREPSRDEAAATSDGAKHLEGGAKHPKTMLADFVGQRPGLGGIRALVFEVLEDAGPQAPQRYLVGVRLGTRLLSSCRAKNQKLASTAAAQQALDVLETEESRCHGQTVSID